ncbi:DNA-directed RNA polymerase III subunit rpc8 [Grifola frondosa]|uniref:DNA-directed RNA polymerase III subunit rpc8 n=1 Tax=Grifola frondosa TaxID=5627 RepID=A0A1C7M9W0_GRIFR|nr:DNA-directed RNA polymerase III subunit rpc8 [Grifola frondosa]
MFVLSIIKDTVAVHPSQFGLPPEQAVTNELNKKYANRVLHDVGLCICVFDLSEVGEGKVRYGDGCLWYKVVFRLVVFRPFPSEVILARVKSSDEEGIRLTVGFFDDMFIPLVYLPEPSAFDSKERAHFWLPNSESKTSHELLDSPLTDRMYIDAGEVVRGVQQVRESRRPPYTITCSIAEQGLGPTSWWKDAGVEAMDEG